MWRRLQNILYSLRSYADLSPDLRMRRRVNQSLRDRPSLSCDEWFERYWQKRNVIKPVADFVYTRMPEYTKLDFTRVRPLDRLDADLHLPLVCWFDWHFSLCDDFWQTFGVDLGDRFDPDILSTVEDLVIFLNDQLVSVNQS